MQSIKRKKGKTIHGEAREIVRHVLQACDEEARTGSLKFILQQRNARVAYYTGISERTISRIRKECQNAGELPLRTPGKHRPRRHTVTTYLGTCDTQIIRTTIQNFYLVEKKVPTSAQILVAIKEKIDFPWGVHSLRRLLKQIGFRWRKCGSKKKILMERSSMLQWRYKYLKSIREAREDGRDIIYLDESWIDKNLTFKKFWQSEEVVDLETNRSSSNHLIIMHAASQNGFVQNGLLLFKPGSATDDCHGQMNHANFEKWVTENLLPNIPPNCVIVMNSAPYNSKEQNEVPTKYAVKSEMSTWLEKNNIPFCATMRKGELMELISKYKSNNKIYHIDEIIKHSGHTVLRLPPYMCELNPIELAWARLRTKIKELNIKTDMSLMNIKSAITEAIPTITADDWKDFCHHVKNVEEEYWAKDAMMETEMEKFVINIGGSDSSDFSSESELDLD